ncbi:uncharacterized protein [Nicotiana tomentosiformis]|uniref:uncharacterized protein n=1 Tax=Nicotiana tomentosiformis TaxID=4098 RepID=UPI00388C878E
MVFTSNLNEKSSEATSRLKESLREFPATSWNDVYNRYSTKLQIEEDTVAQPKANERTGSRRSKSEKRTGKNKYKPYIGPAGRDSRSKQESVRFDSRSRKKDTSSSSRFKKKQDTRGNDSNTHAKIGDYIFNVSTSELVAVLRGMEDKVRWPKEMRSGPSKRNPDFWCKFHNDHGHRTADFRLLHGEVEHLLKQAARKTSKVTVTHGKRVRQVLDGDSITFDDEDTYGLLIPHNDTVVISLLVHDTNVNRVLIDPGSSINIILLRVVNEMQADNKIIPKARSLSGFDNSSVITKREVLLTTFAEGVVKDMKFQVIDTDMTYNIILGRMWIHEMDAVPSTLHQVIKFPSPWGIRQICGDQQASRNITSVVVSSMVDSDTDAK